MNNGSPTWVHQRLTNPKDKHLRNDWRFQEWLINLPPKQQVAALLFRDAAVKFVRNRKVPQSMFGYRSLTGLKPKWLRRIVYAWLIASGWKIKPISFSNNGRKTWLQTTWCELTTPNGDTKGTKLYYPDGRYSFVSVGDLERKAKDELQQLYTKPMFDHLMSA